MVQAHNSAETGKTKCSLFFFAIVMRAIKWRNEMDKPIIESKEVRKRKKREQGRIHHH